MSDMFNQAAPTSSLLTEWQDYTLEEAQNLVRQYPYFAPAQFLLLQKLPKPSEEYLQQYQKAILYHKDILEFESLLHSDKFTTDFGADTIEPEVPVVEEYEDLAIAEELPEVNTVLAPPQSVELVESSLEATPLTIDVPAEPSKPTVTPVEEVNHSQPEPTPTLVEVAAEPVEPLPPPVKLVNELQQEPPVPTEVPNKPQPEPVEELAFEPYHTVDYFASQGIKATQDPAPTDRFGKQLKSFTEWLKTMKRLSPADLSKNLDPKAEQKVENLAEHSLQNPDVATEAMAEVWIKQGNREKAAEVYRKLSLLNPAKSAYFAAKIENLNGS